MKSILPIALTILVVSLYFALFFQYALNIPKWDDFALIQTISDFQNSDNWLEKLQVLTKQHNEHRIAFTRILAIIDFWVFGELNFVHLMVLGSLSLLVITSVFFYIIYHTNKDYWLLFCISIFWFSLAFYENSFWGMASVQNFWIVAIVILINYSLAYREQKLIIPFFLAVLALFTSGNGLLVIPLLAINYFLKKQYRFFTIWLLFSALLLFVYFFSYTVPPVVPSTPFNLLAFLKGVIILGGSMLEGVPIAYNAILLFGVFFLSWAIAFIGLMLFKMYYLREALSSRNCFIFLSLFFTLATCFLVSYNRVGSYGPESLLLSRYKPYSALLISLFLFKVADFSLINRFFIRLVLVFVASFCFISYQHYFLKNVIDQRRFLNSISFNWNNLRTSDSPTSEIKIYKKSFLYLDQFENYRQKLPVKMNEESVSNDFTYHITINYINNQNFLDAGPYLVLVNESNCYIIPFLQGRRHSIRNILNYFNFNNFTADLDLNLKETEILPGKYLLQLLNNDKMVDLNNRVLEIPNITKPKVLSNW